MTTRKLLAIGVLALTAFVSACSTQAVRCDGKLSLINAPAPASKATQKESAEVAP